jgi:O-acetyl-ADP-ribose deacetylase (regulator of RNase III)
MQLHLVDIDADVVRAWEAAFAGLPGVDIACEDILRVARVCVVSPANSFGYMDGGLDEAYYDFFGPQIQVKVQAEIDRRPERLLPVGGSLLIPTGHPRIPFLIVAPTMEMPGPVWRANVYHAMVAVLRCAARRADVITDVYCPGLATGTGRVEPSIAAAEMAAAYRDWTARGNPSP